jgi:hypothetical protein
MEPRVEDYTDSTCVASTAGAGGWPWHHNSERQIVNVNSFSFVLLSFFSIFLAVLILESLKSRLKSSIQQSTT